MSDSDNKYWGYHGIFDCYKGDILLITSPENIKNFIVDLVETIDMVAYGEPIIEHFATHDPEKAGYSLVQLIETSSITGHFVDKTGEFYIDVFSCKPYDIQLVRNCIQEYFNPESISAITLNRQANFLVQDNW